MALFVEPLDLEQSRGGGVGEDPSQLLSKLTNAGKRVEIDHS